MSEDLGELREQSVGVGKVGDGVGSAAFFKTSPMHLRSVSHPG